MKTKPTAEKKLGDNGYLNKNCWLATNVGYPPAKRCQYCELKFRNCLFEKYLIMTLILVFLVLAAAYVFEGQISRALIIAIFAIVVSYGYFFNKSTEKIIISNFEEKKAKNAFRELSGTLQQKVEEQTKEIKEAYEVEKRAHEELKKTDESKTNFMLATQHHLRTPLTVTMGFLDLLLNGNYGKIPKKAVEVLNKANKSIKKEISVVNDLLNVSTFQLGKGGIEIEPEVEIKEIIKEIVEELTPEAESKNIYLKFEETGGIPTISADKKQIKLALSNIIDNGVKYTKKGGVSIKAESTGGKVIIKVKDTGIGMDLDGEKSLFKEAFQRSTDAKMANATGKGIGVYLSDQVVKAHGGKITAESEGKGRGSTFSIELPIK